MRFELLQPTRAWGRLRRAFAVALMVSLTMGVVVVPEAWATRHVATTGNDSGGANDCSDSGAPCRTITHALTQASAEDIQVAPGTYNQGLGETFPLALKDGVQIIGTAGATTTTISAPAGTNAFTNDDTPLSATTRLSGFTLQHDSDGVDDLLMEFAVDGAAMAPQIDHNVFQNDGLDGDDGILFFDDGTADGSVTALIDSNTFTGLDDAVTLSQSSGGSGDVFSPTISNNTFTDCYLPLVLTINTSGEGTMAPQITGNTSTGTDYTDIYIYCDPDYTSGLLVSPTITANTFGSIPSSTGASTNIYIDIDYSSATGAVTFNPTISNNTFFASDNNIDQAYLDVSYGSSADFTYAPTISNNTFTSSGGDNYWGTTLYVYSHSGNVEFTPTFSNNTFTASSGSNLYFYSFSVSSLTGDFTFNPVVTDNPQLAASDFNFTLYYGWYCDVDGAASVSPTITGNTMSGASSEAISIYYTTLSMYSSTQVNTFSPTINNNTIQAVGEDGVYIYLSDLEYGRFESDLTIQGNTITGADYGIDISFDYFSDGHGWDADWLIANNTITSPSSDGIFLSFNTMSVSCTTGVWDLTIEGNTITDAGSYGMYLYPAYSWFSDAELHQTILIQGNTVTGSGDDGIYLYLSDQTGLQSNDVQILDNVIQGGDEDGLQVESYDYGANSILVACNTITGNASYGVNQGDGYDPPADYGGGNLASPGNNVLMGNTLGDFSNLDDDPVKAENNWWGTTDTATIDANILDDEEAGNGAVDFDPYLAAATTVAVSASLVDAVVIDVAPAGPSVGDTIEYTATVSLTGGCGDSAVLFEAPIPANATVVAGSVATGLGDVYGDDPVAVMIGHLTGSDTVTITWQVVPDSGTEITSQGTATGGASGATLSDDPDVGGTSDPTVTVFGQQPQPAAGIPALGQWGMLLLMGLLLLTGLALLRRRGSAAALVLTALFVPSLIAQPPDRDLHKGPATTTQVATVGGFAKAAGTVTLTLADGIELTVPERAVKLKVRRNEDKKAARLAWRQLSREERRAARGAEGEAKRAAKGSRAKSVRQRAPRLADLPAGQAAIARVEYNVDGSVKRVHLQVFESERAAVAALERRELRQQARDAKQAAGQR